MKKNKKIIIMSLILLVGIAISVFAFLMMKQNQLKAAETKEIVVLSRDVYPYETIGANDLMYIRMPLDTATKGYAIQKQDLSGKVASDYLVAETLILNEDIVDKSEIENIEFITLKTDYTRTGGARVGDIIDVYKVISPTKTSSSEIKLVAENAIVVSVTDREGTNVFASNKGGTLGVVERKIPIQAVKLAIDSRTIDIKKIVEGSVNGDNYVMIVKNLDFKSLELGGN